jgi:aminoglycoside 6'-N-acetyltransferase I
MKIADLTPENAPAIEQVAELLVAGFRDTGSASWRSIREALEEVQKSLQPGRISRIAVDEQSGVLGWIGGIEEYDGNVWELHPLVVRQDCQRQGVGRTLVADFERQVAERGGHTIWLGTEVMASRTF